MMIVGVVQARFSSARLPGKVLMPLAGRPMLAHVLDVLRQSAQLDGVILATSDHHTDDAVAGFAASCGVPCYRGDLQDVAARLLAAARRAGADALVRVSGDSPLLDPALVDRAVKMFRRGEADVVTNVAARSFPKGQSVEVIATASLARALPRMATAEQREHVTPYFYAHRDAFVIRSFTAARPRPDLQLSVDTAADLARCEAILRLLGQPAWQAGWEACARASEALPQQVAS